MATAIDAQLAEYNAAIVALESPIRGLQDFDRIDIHPDTKQIVDETLADFQRRSGLLQTAINALTALQNDGYPALDVRSIPGSPFEDLRGNTTDLEAAFAMFSEANAVALGLSSGPPEPKNTP